MTEWCRLMETRDCPPAGCVDKPCARFESEDPTPWEESFEDPLAVMRGILATATIAVLVMPGRPTARLINEMNDILTRKIKESREGK